MGSSESKIQDEPAIGATVGPSVVPTVEPTVEPTAGPTIFDYLLEDCWRAVLDYVPLRDIIRSERVSRQWQAVVLGYLSHSRIGILAPGCQDPGTHRNVQMLELQDIDWPSFERWTKKLGPSVVLICLQPTKNKILIVRKNCPNLETITFISFTNEVIPVAYQNERLTKLRRICFGGICKMSDSIIGPFLANDTIEELELGSHSRLVQMTGQWLIDIKLTNLKSLILKNPYSSLIFRNFLTAAASGLLNLTRLELMDVGKTLYKEINSALEKLPALETLCFMVYKGTLKINGSDDYGFFKAVSRLSRLKHLKTNVAAADEGVLAVTRSCEELQVLMLEHCPGVTERGLASAWRSAGGRLTALGLLKCAHMTEDMLVATVTSCPNLKLLDVDVVLTEGLLARTAAARRDGGAHRRVLCMRTSAGPLRNNTETERDDDGSANAMPIDNEPRWNREDLKNYPELKLTFGVHFSCYYDWTSGDSYYCGIHAIKRTKHYGSDTSNGQGTSNGQWTSNDNSQGNKTLRLALSQDWPGAVPQSHCSSSRNLLQQDLDSHYPELRVAINASFKHCYDWTSGHPITWEYSESEEKNWKPAGFARMTNCRGAFYNGDPMCQFVSYDYLYRLKN